VKGGLRKKSARGYLLPCHFNYPLSCPFNDFGKFFADRRFSPPPLMAAEYFLGWIFFLRFSGNFGVGGEKLVLASDIGQAKNFQQEKKGITAVGRQSSRWLPPFWWGESSPFSENIGQNL